MDAKVLYDYVARGSDELTIKQGDTISNVSPSNMDGWFVGTLEGQTGIFPGNFVEVLEEPDYDYPPPPLPYSPPSYPSSSSAEPRTDFLFPADYNQMGSVSVVAEEDEWWKGKLKGEVQVFAPPSPKRVPTSHGAEKAVMLMRSSSVSDPILYGRTSPSHTTHNTQSVKRMAIVKPMSPEGSIPVPHTTTEERAAERSRQVQQVSRIDPARIQTMEEKLRHVYAGRNGPTGSSFVPSGSSHLPNNTEEDNNNGLAETDIDGAFDLVSNFQTRGVRTVSDVAGIGPRDELKKVSATFTGPFVEPKPSSNHHQSRIRQDPIPKKEEFEKQTNVRRHSSMSGKTAMMTMFEDMMRGEQSPVGPIPNPNYPSHQTNASDDRNVASRRGGWPSGRHLTMAGAGFADLQRVVGAPSSSSNYANIFRDPPRNIPSSMSPSTSSHPPAPPPSHTKPRPGLGYSYSTSSYSARMTDDRWRNPAEMWRTGQGPPQVPDYPDPSPPRYPPQMQVQHNSGSLSSSSSTAEGDGQGRSTLLDGIRKSKLHPVPTADNNDTPQPR